MIVRAMGAGAADGGADPAPYLAVPKSVKLMAKQDRMALVAAARAAAAAGHPEALRGPRAGVYMAVGFVSFEAAALEPLCRASAGEDGGLCMARFSTAGFNAVHPLRTFQCLPNMPLYHVSVNLQVRGPYFISYPGPAQFYLALDRAAKELAAGRVAAALVGGVADQENFLVRHHFRRLGLADGERLADGAAFLVLASEGAAGGARGPALERLHIEYGGGPDGVGPLGCEELMVDGAAAAWGGGPGYLGAAGPAAALAWAMASGAGEVIHRLRTADGYRIEAAWRQG